MMDNERNIDAFEKLLKRYDEITMFEIIKTWNMLSSVFENLTAGDVANRLTGFSKVKTCTLCKEAIQIVQNNRSNYLFMCDACVINIDQEKEFMCTEPLFDGDTSYDQIDNSETPEELFNAYKARAKALRKFYKLHYGEEL